MSRLSLLLTALAMVACHETLTGPFRDPNFVPVPSAFDSAFGAGTAKWFSTRTFDTITAATMDAQSIYTADKDSATGPSLVSLQLGNGVLRWKKALSAPATDIVLAGTTVGAVTDTLAAFDVTTGAFKFSYAPPNLRRISSNGAGDNTRIYVGNKKGELVALNAGTGAEVWSPTIDTAAVTGVTVSGGTVYAAGNGFLAAVNATTGATLWKKIITDTPKPTGLMPPAVDSGRVSIIGSPAATAAIANYNATTGAFGWALGPDLPPGRVETPGSSVCDGFVFTASATSITAYYTVTAPVKWSRSLSAYSNLSASCSYGSLIVSSRVNWAGGAYNDVLVLRASDGGVLTSFPKTPGTRLRIFVAMRDATRFYFLTDQGVIAISAP